MRMLTIDPTVANSFPTSGAWQGIYVAPCPVEECADGTDAHTYRIEAFRCTVKGEEVVMLGIGPMDADIALTPVTLPALRALLLDLDEAVR